MIKHIDKHARKQKRDSWKDYLPEALRKMWARELNTLNTIQIDSEQLLRNYRYLKDASHKSIFPTLKSNAYGHGIEQITSILKNEEPEYYFVDSYYEWLRIREIDTSARILIGWYIPKDNLPKLHLEWATPVVSDIDTLKVLHNQNKNCKIHLKINTWMNRGGLKPEELSSFLEIIERSKKINLEWVCTHFCDADNHRLDTTNDQSEMFTKVLQTVHNSGFVPKFTHLSNSAWLFKESIWNTARPGISLYGVNPLCPVDMYSSYYNPINPCMRVVSKIVYLQKIKKGESVGYNQTYTVQRDSMIATVPFGYHEWIPRSLSNSWNLSFRWKHTPIVGNVCMNHTLLDVTDCKDVSLEDEIIILNWKKDGTNSIYEVASMQNTIPYEVYTNMESTIRRIIT